MRSIGRILGRSAVIGRVYGILLRAKRSLRYFRRSLANWLKWLVHSKETTNFTYDLEPHNVEILAALIADVLGTEFNEIMFYIKELAEDVELRNHIFGEISNSDYAFMADETARYGRRIGWYAIARATKPKTVIETGVDKGLGACVLTAALKRNQEDGVAGKYIGTDINPRAGFLLTGIYAQFGHIRYGDSIESLESFAGTVDLFINDSDHSPDYEAAEYETVRNKLSANAILLGDNAHVTNELLKFSLQNSRHFVFFQEKPLNHWYPGAGIGISFTR